MMHLVVYDISENSRRLRVAEYLEGKGCRIQESVFECALSGDEVDRTAADLAKLAGNRPGTIRIYPVCSECYAKTIGIGDIKKEIGKKGYAVF